MPLTAGRSLPVAAHPGRGRLHLLVPHEGCPIHHPDQHQISTPYPTWENATPGSLSNAPRNHQDGNGLPRGLRAQCSRSTKSPPMADCRESDPASLVPDQGLGQAGSQGLSRRSTDGIRFSSGIPLKRIPVAADVAKNNVGGVLVARWAPCSVYWAWSTLLPSQRHCRVRRDVYVERPSVPVFSAPVNHRALNMSTDTRTGLRDRVPYIHPGVPQLPRSGGGSARRSHRGDDAEPDQHRGGESGPAGQGRVRPSGSR
jgi:hypothetical protein